MHPIILVSHMISDNTASQQLHSVQGHLQINAVCLFLFIAKECEKHLLKSSFTAYIYLYLGYVGTVEESLDSVYLRFVMYLTFTFIFKIYSLDIQEKTYYRSYSPYSSP